MPTHNQPDGPYETSAHTLTRAHPHSDVHTYISRMKKGMTTQSPSSREGKMLLQLGGGSSAAAASVQCSNLIKPKHHCSPGLLQPDLRQGSASRHLTLPPSR